MGYFEYELKNESKSKGSFYIYQGKNGAIYLVMGNAHTNLTYEQVTDLRIDVCSLQDFDFDSYKKYYKLDSIF